MHIPAVCFRCHEEFGLSVVEPFLVPYYDERMANTACSRGHDILLVIQSQKFEVLLNSGTGALFEGYTLEAAATFSAALERFIEFATKVMLLHLGMTEPRYDQMYAEMARQSERQLGSFLALHSLVLGTAFVPNKDIAPFRNSVIHKGKIPTPLEANRFCENVYAEIHRTLLLLQMHCDHSINRAISSDINLRLANIPKETRTVTTAVHGPLSLAHADHKPTFKDALEAYIEAASALKHIAKLP